MHRDRRGALDEDDDDEDAQSAMQKLATMSFTGSG